MTSGTKKWLRGLLFFRSVMSSSSHFWQGRSVFVTGATGLVGTFVVKRLLKLGALPVCLVRDRNCYSELVQSGLLDKVTVVHGELQDAALAERILGEYEVATVFHLAAQAIVGVANRNPMSTFDSNLRGTWTLLEACRRSPLVREIVVASSDKAYGDQPELPYTEDSPLLAKHPYDVSKACTDLIAQSYAHTFELPVTIARCGNFYGPGDTHWNRIIPGTIRSVLRNERPQIRSDGTSIRDYFYVEDGAEAYIALAEALASKPELRGEAFNFSNEEPLTVLEIVDHVLTLMKSDLKPEVLNTSSNEIAAQHLSATKARKVLGWKPKYTLEQGLIETIPWYTSLLQAS